MAKVIINREASWPRQSTPVQIHRIQNSTYCQWIVERERMAAFALPSLVCLRSVYNDKYLRYRYENVQTRGLLQFAGENVTDPYAQFEVEKAKTWAGLVHLKSRYTNKYLVR